MAQARPERLGSADMLTIDCASVATTLGFACCAVCVSRALSLSLGAGRGCFALALSSLACAARACACCLARLASSFCLRACTMSSCLRFAR